MIAAFKIAGICAAVLYVVHEIDAAVNNKRSFTKECFFGIDEFWAGIGAELDYAVDKASQYGDVQQ